MARIQEPAIGEVVTIGIGDVGTVAMALTTAGPGFGGLVAYAVVAVVLFTISPLLAIIVLAGVPILAGVVGPLLMRLNHTGAACRQQQGVTTARIDARHRPPLHLRGSAQRLQPPVV